MKKKHTIMGQEGDKTRTLRKNFRHTLRAQVPLRGSQLDWVFISIFKHVSYCQSSSINLN
jgi:hypothetical protein